MGERSFAGKSRDSQTGLGATRLREQMLGTQLVACRVYGAREEIGTEDTHLGVIDG